MMAIRNAYLPSWAFGSLVHKQNKETGPTIQVFLK
jgi:hypothetical protein